MLRLSSHTNILFFIFHSVHRERASVLFALFCYFVVFLFNSHTCCSRRLLALVPADRHTAFNNNKKYFLKKNQKKKSLQDGSLARWMGCRSRLPANTNCGSRVAGGSTPAVCSVWAATGEVKNRFVTHCCSCDLTGKGTKQTKK